jgi:excisionase family DNA binding protein
MSLFDESVLREIIRDEVRTVIRQEMGNKPAAAGDYVSVAEAAQIASVQGQTIRSWIRSGDLTGYKAGRVLRVRRTELEAFLAGGSPSSRTTELSPEQLADQRFQERQAQRSERTRMKKPSDPARTCAARRSPTSAHEAPDAAREAQH